MRRVEPASALLFATLIAGLLAVAASGLLTQARAARAGAGEAVRMARAKANGDALLAHALIELDQNGAIQTAGVSRQDATGLVDINASSTDTLSALLMGLGVAEDEAAELADRIADWRDDDDLTRLHGAERAEYRAAGRAEPANRNFAVETELNLVLGMPPDLVRCLAPLLTTYSGLSSPELSEAPASLRNLFHYAGSIAAHPAPVLGHVVILTADAPLSPQSLLRSRIWVRLTGDDRRPFIIHRADQSLAPTEEHDHQECSIAEERS